jgi:hypothetical protein
MLCTYCSTQNPESNRFCGECGQPLVRQPVAVPAEERHQTTISGPSFLGLTDSSQTDTADYLLEDERPRKSHFGWFLFSAVAIAVLAVIGWMEWQAIQTGKLPVPGLKTTSASQPPGPATTTDATGAPVAPAAPGSVSALPADAKPQSDGPDSTTAKNSDVVATPAPKSDAQATQESQSRLAKQRMAEVPASDESNGSETPAEKPAAKTKSVAETSPKPEDPRQNRMLVSGEKYLYGRGVPQDCNQALIYFKAAAESDNVPAMSHLGAMYASGHCVTPNRVVAYKWFARASEVEPRNEWFSRNLNMLWRDMSPQERAAVAR